MNWYRKKDDFNNGFFAGVLYTSAAGLALLGFLGTCAYVYHHDVQKKLEQYERKIEDLESKLKN